MIGSRSQEENMAGQGLGPSETTMQSLQEPGFPGDSRKLSQRSWDATVAERAKEGWTCITCARQGSPANGQRGQCLWSTS